MILSSPHQNSSLPRISANMRGERCVEVRIADQLPARLVDEGKADVEDDEVDVGEVGGGSVHVPGLRVFDRLRSERYALVDADQVDTQLLRLLEHREGDTRGVPAPRERLAVVVAHVVDLERLRTELVELPFHEIEGAPAFQRVRRAPEDRAVRVTRGELGAFLPG